MRLYYGEKTHHALKTQPEGPPMDQSLIRALIQLTQAQALSSYRNKELSKEEAAAIEQVTTKLLARIPKEQFPLSPYQAQGGLATIINVEEVITHLIQEQHALTLQLPESDPEITFAAAMQLAAIEQIKTQLFPLIDALDHQLKEKATTLKDQYTVSRKHLQDDAPIPFATRLQSYTDQLNRSANTLHALIETLSHLPISSKSLLTPLAKLTRQKLHSTPYLPAHDQWLPIQSALTQLGTALHKIATDIQLLTSGPNNGLNELEHAHGTPLTPEVTLQLLYQLDANQSLITRAIQSATFETNSFAPLIFSTHTHSIHLLTQSLSHLTHEIIIPLTFNSVVWFQNPPNAA
ncbi:MAG: Fumarate hydratase class II [Chlamydiia bacterium]|nr:Fumarate hydratase class II [Chlamydiia bacterium]